MIKISFLGFKMHSLLDVVTMFLYGVTFKLLTFIHQSLNTHQKGKQTKVRIGPEKAASREKKNFLQKTQKMNHPCSNIHGGLQKRPSRASILTTSSCR